MINQYLPIAQIVVAVLLVGSILLQRKEGGLGGALGGGSESVNQFSTRRGMEKVIHHITVVLVVLFFALAIARIAIK
ncbi:MAG TPA: preprotein translocase subunit SecG [Candidatus Paceibacterota bacterium]|nr:preprotein translocase subunit SecG [Candidatus Paceibacterota bacterium]